MENRQAMLAAFDRLFAKTADKMGVSYTPEELTAAQDAFAERMAKLLEIVATLPFDAVAEGTVDSLEKAIDQLSPAQVVGQIATIPLLQHSQELLQQLAYRAAEQRFVESALEQVDTTYGGN